MLVMHVVLIIYLATMNKAMAPYNNYALLYNL